MKKMLLVSMTVFTITTSYSQTEKGEKFIGGQFNLSGSNNSTLDTLSKFSGNSLNFQISPNFGYFIKDNLAVGANLNFGLSNSSGTQNNPYGTPSSWTNKSNTMNYGGGGFVRYYKKITDNFLFFANGGASYIYQTQKLKYSNNDPSYIYSSSNPASQETQTNSVSVAISPGLVYFITPKFGIETSFGKLFYNYSSSKNKSLLYDNHHNTNTYGLNLSLATLSFGLNYYF